MHAGCHFSGLATRWFRRRTREWMGDYVGTFRRSHAPTHSTIRGAVHVRLGVVQDARGPPLQWSHAAVVQASHP